MLAVNEGIKGPCEWDLCDPRRVVEHFKDLINLYDMLGESYDIEMQSFLSELHKVGWSEDRVFSMLIVSGYGTRWEQDLPAPVRNRGSYKEYRKIKVRMG